MAGQIVIVHSLDHARAALAAAAALGLPVTLASAPGAAGTVGPGWFQEVVAQATADFPQVTVSAVIDCAEQPGHVLAALRQGLKRVRFTGAQAVAAKLSAIAEAQDAELVTGDLPALDLRGQPRPEQACRDWLETSP